jgi:pimeloyl-ACP methyl ester carboxylesterase
MAYPDLLTGRYRGGVPDEVRADPPATDPHPARSAREPAPPGARRRAVTLHGEQISFWDRDPAGTGHASRGHSGERADGVLVLVHGMAGSATTWAPVLAELDRRGDTRRVIAPDLAGHGSTSALWADYSLGGYATGLRDLLAALGHTHATVVGHSLGGGVVQHFAWAFPEHCDRLVLVASGGLGREVSPLLRAAVLPGADWVLPLLTDRHTLHAAEIVGRILAGPAGWALPALSREAREAHQALASLTDPDHRRAFLYTARSVIDAHGQRVSALNRLYLTEGLPVLLVWGTDDTLIPPAHGERAHTLIAASRLELLDGAGHFPHRDQPDRFTAVLLDFLEDTRPARRSSADHAARIAAHAVLTSGPREPEHLRNCS